MSSSPLRLKSPEVKLIKVYATQTIEIFDGTGEPPYFIQPGETFWVNTIPLEGCNGLVAHLNGDSFFVQPHEFKRIMN